MTDKRSKLEKEVVKLERQIASQQERVNGLLANDDFAKAEKEQKKLADLSVQADLRRQRINQLIAGERDEQDRERQSAIDALTKEMVGLEAVMKTNGEASIAVHGYWQSLADRCGKGAGDNPMDWSQEREDRLLSDLERLVEKIKPLLAPVNFGDAIGLEWRYRQASRERDELMGGKS